MRVSPKATATRPRSRPGRRKRPRRKNLQARKALRKRVRAKKPAKRSPRRKNKFAGNFLRLKLQCFQVFAKRCAEFGIQQRKLHGGFQEAEFVTRVVRNPFIYISP